LCKCKTRPGAAVDPGPSQVANPPSSMFVPRSPAALSPYMHLPNGACGAMRERGMVITHPPAFYNFLHRDAWRVPCGRPSLVRAPVEVRQSTCVCSTLKDMSRCCDKCYSVAARPVAPRPPRPSPSPCTVSTVDFFQVHDIKFGFRRTPLRLYAVCDGRFIKECVGFCKKKKKLLPSNLNDIGIESIFGRILQRLLLHSGRSCRY